MSNQRFPGSVHPNCMQNEPLFHEKLNRAIDFDKFGVAVGVPEMPKKPDSSQVRLQA